MLADRLSTSLSTSNAELLELPISVSVGLNLLNKSVDMFWGITYIIILAMFEAKQLCTLDIKDLVFTVAIGT